MLGEWIHQPLHHAGRVDPPTIASCWESGSTDHCIMLGEWIHRPLHHAREWIHRPLHYARRVDPPTIASCSQSGSTDHCIMLAEWILWPLHHTLFNSKLIWRLPEFLAMGSLYMLLLFSCIESATLNLSPWRDTLSAAASEAPYCSKESDFWSSFNEDSLK